MIIRRGLIEETLFNLPSQCKEKDTSKTNCNPFSIDRVIVNRKYIFNVDG